MKQFSLPFAGLRQLSCPPNNRVTLYKQVLATLSVWVLLPLLTGNTASAQCIPYPNVANSGCTTDSLYATGLAPGGNGSNTSGVLALSGSSQYLQTGITSLAGSAITIEYWFKGTQIQSAVRQQNGGNYIVAGWSNYPTHILSDDGGTGNGLRVDATGNSVIYNGQWHHVAMTWQQNTTNGFCSYLDGVLQQQRNSANVTLTNIGANVLIGSYVGSGEFTAGDIDNVRIWSVARTQTQLQADMFLETISDTAGIIAQFKMNGDFTCANNPAYNATPFNSPVFTTANYYTYTWSGPNAPLASTNEVQPVTITGSSQTYSCVASYSTYSFCSGSPNTTTIGPCIYASANPNIISSGGTSTLTVADYGTGGAIQWMQAPDGVTWSAVSGGSGGATPTYTTGSLTSTTYYEAVVTGGTSPGTSNIITVTVPNYCTPGADLAISCTYMSISKVAITGTTLNSNSGCNAPYINYPDTGTATANLTAGNTYTINLSDAFAPNGYNNNGTPLRYFSVWIDANQNGVFESDEQVVFDFATISGSTTFTVPANAFIGPTRMRVREDYNYYGNTNGNTPTIDNPCAALYYGETEDYTVNIVPTATAFPNPLWCSGANATLTIGNYTSGTIQWQIATTNSPYNWQNISGATTSPYTTTGGISATTYYQAIVTNPGVSDTSNVITVTITSPPSNLFNPGITGATTLNVGGTCNFCINNPIPIATGSLPTGGTITTSGGYRIHTFTSNGPFIVPAGFNTTAEVLVVAGGGGGGGSNQNDIAGGGGGAGGLIHNGSYAITSGATPVVVGAGGTGATGFTVGTNGGNSAFGSLSAIGGGYGGTWTISPSVGGSGGGAGENGQGLVGAAGTAGQGNAGGNGNPYMQPYISAGGGGGGAGSVGATETSNVNGGAGGAGLAYSISGSTVYYAGGGGGAGYNTAGPGGAGGGGNGRAVTSGNGYPGTPYTGGGGGGALTNYLDPAYTGGNGGSGVVIVRYLNVSSIVGWASDNTAVATVDPSSGLVTGISPGTANITYSVSVGGCSIALQTIPVMVNQPVTTTMLCINGKTSAGINTSIPTGGTVTTYGGYRIHTFLASDTFNVPSGFSSNVDVLLVAGGGGGGSDMGGGGGGGGVIYQTNLYVSPGSNPVTVGAGGNGAPAGGQEPAGSNGGNSVFNSLTAIGGGGGGSNYNSSSTPAGSGGSGGGSAGCNNPTPGSGTTGQGNSGGASGGCYYPGGGGGAGGAGTNNPATGGPGIVNSILGTAYYWGGGGGGSGYSSIGGNGGIGGGGGGAVGVTTGGAGLNNGSPGGGGVTNAQTNMPGGNAGANTGGGGGGGSHYNSNNYGGNGGSGIIIIRYPLGVWTSSNTAVATVDSNGIITGISAGTATITCTATGSSCTSVQTVIVTVQSSEIGTASATPPAVCSGGSTTLSLAGNTATGLQWQQSADGNTGWVNVTGGSGATSVSYITPALTSTTYYRAQASGSCAANSAVVPVTVTPTPPYVSIGISGATTISVNETSTLCVSNTAPTGGTITSVNGYRIHTFSDTGSNSFVIPSGFNANVQVLVVAGGGGGGGSSGNDIAGGGGGAGGLIYNSSYTVSPGNIAITVGAGGNGSTGFTAGKNGGNSVFGSLTAIGGGYGGTWEVTPGVGGSGGGSGENYQPAGNNYLEPYGSAGTAGQGNAGGNGNIYAEPYLSGGGGGGGAGSAGANETDSLNGGAGGAGLAYSISGSSVYYAGGGGGAGYGSAGLGGNGGGGSGRGINSGNGYAGTPNTGGGGGGALTNYNDPTFTGGSGGSGVVIIQYPDVTVPGVWSSDNTAVATVDPSTGIVTGVSTGTANISYSISIGACTIALQTVPVTVNAAVTAVALCVNGTVSSGINTATLTGGSFNDAGGYRIHTFTSSGTLTIPSNFNSGVDVLVVAGGGGGGSDMGGGGGGGGVVYQTNLSVSPGSIPVTVGTGGAGAQAGGAEPSGSNGTNSVFSSITAIGGGGGGSNYNSSNFPAQNGGSGGGSAGCNNGNTGGAGTAGQGYSGSGGAGCYYPGGGGGAGGVGLTSPATGGPGVANSILGTAYYWGGGGGGAGYSGIGGNGGIGGGGGGAVGTTTGGAGFNNGLPGGGGVVQTQTNEPGGNAGANTGGGGGGGSHYNSNNYGGNGGSGIVIIRYPHGVWSSSNTAIATVDSNGTITGVSPGNTTVTYTLSSGNCATVQTVPVTVSSTVVGTPSVTSPAICSGGSTTISLTGNGGTGIQWEQSANGTSGWANVTAGSGATSTTYTTPVLTATTYYRVKASGACNGHSSVVPVNVTPTPPSITYGTLNPQTISVNGTSSLCLGNTSLPTGGIVTTSGGYRIHTFTANDTFNAPTGFNANVEVLVVAGGGGGGSFGGGGGAGGLIYNNSFPVTGGIYPITIGAGGAGATTSNVVNGNGTNGSNSVFSSLTAIGGGGGGTREGSGQNYQGAPGSNGGSGGGGANSDNSAGGVGGLGTAGQGNAGGTGGSGTTGTPNYSHGGGGGAGGVGGTGKTNGDAGAFGGVGLQFPQFAAVGGYPAGWFAGGGGGGIYTTGINGVGGLGGGGNGGDNSIYGLQATPGVANTGGGGGGGMYQFTGGVGGGTGGSGVVIIKYLDITSYPGTWSSDNTAVATVNPTTGVVTGVSAGTANINYSVSIGSCNFVIQTVPFTVNPAIAAMCVNATTPSGITAPSIPPAPSGGTMATVGGYRVHTFISSGTFTVPSGFTNSVQALVVAGGGGGGGSSGNDIAGGGGGAGGLIYKSSLSGLSGAVTVTVGAGGAGATGFNTGTNGGNSVFGTLTAIGGGAGGTWEHSATAGGSGGGGGENQNTQLVGAAGTAGQGYAGGNGNYYLTTNNSAGGGGGGAGGAGINQTDSVNGGAGGAGLAFSISGSSVYYAGGGGGGGSVTIGAGGTGGGGNGAGPASGNGSPGIANTGGGGGGALTNNNDPTYTGGTGGSGIVIVSYAYPVVAWVSSNTSVATVDTTGTITAIGPGSATITCTVTSGGCVTVQTVSVTVNSSLIGSATATPAAICTGSTTTVNLTGNSGSALQWQQSIDGITNWANVAGGSGPTAASYTTANLDTSIYFRVLSSGLCSGNSAPVEVLVTELPTSISYGTAGSTSIPLNGTVALCGITVPTGGTVTTSGGYRIHTFTSNGTFSTSAGFNANVAVLVVAGGGGGGSDMGGGGGGGGVIYNPSFTLTGTEIPVIVGAGGTGAYAGSNQHAGLNGLNSVFSTLTAIGGGGGGSEYSNGNYPAGNGGSGGGTAGPNASPGTGTAGQGYAGGGSTGQWYPGGGGGAGGAGSTSPATGGPGLACSILGTTYYWGGGGGGSGYSGIGGNGGIGGGGGGAVGTTTGGAGLNNGSAGGGGTINNCTQTPGGNAGANTGGGGGGGSYCNSNNYGGNGGSGIVIIKYPDISNGQWSSDNTAVATVNVSTGVVTGVDTGTANITYSYTYGACIIALKTYPVTVTSPVAPICINGTSTSGISVPAFTPATGGTVSVTGGYRIHSFTASDTLHVPSGFTSSVDVLVVAGGGGGGSDMGGGGGGGGVIFQNQYSISAGSIPVNIGSGGFGATAGSGQPAGHNGGNSVFGPLTAIGGGGGGSEYSNNNSPAGNGGSGGGTAGPNSSPGTGTTGQGYAGGSSAGQWYPGGGGGAGGPGSTDPGNGGAGIYNDILGTGYYWGGGGGGSGYSGNGGNGGIGGGGGGAVGTTTGGAGLNNGSAGGGGTTNNCVQTPGGSAGAHTGGGGGGGSYCNANNQGGEGGSGIVVVRYPNLSATWSSSNTAVATVDTSGNVTGVSAGTATITCTIVNGRCTILKTASVTISSTVIGSVSTANPTLCSGGSTSVSLTGNAGGDNLQWQQSADGVTGWANVTGGIGNTTSTYLTPALTSTTYYRVQATGACVANSQVVPVAIVGAPTITLGASPTCSGGATSADLPYTDTTGSPNQYSVSYDATAQSFGFTNISLAALTSTPLVLPVPGSAPSGTYNGTITVTNSAAGCSGTPVAFTITVLNGCIGTNPGNTLSTLYSANPGVSFTLTLSNIPSPVSGVTYQWQSSTNNITYTNIGGATSYTYTTSETATTWYQCVTTCTSNSATGTSTPVQINNCSITPHGAVAVSQPFNNPSLPTGWTDTVVTGTQAWTFTNTPTFNSLSGGNYAVFNDNLGAHGSSEAALVTPSMNFLNHTNVKLSYYTYWYAVELTHGFVEISNNGGLTWDTIQNYELTTVGSLTAPSHVEINISAYAANQCDVVVRFVYTDGGQAGQFWYLDDIDFYDAVDVGVTNLVAPGYLGCSSTYGTSDSVTVTIENYSLDSISNIPIVCLISGGITQTLNGTYTGTIPGLGFANFTFPVTANLSADAEYTFRIFTQLSNDSYHANDTLIEGRHQLVSDYSYLENFNSSNGGWLSGMNGTDTARYFAWGPVPYLNGPQGFGNSWYLNVGDNGWNGDVWVESPVFDLTGLTSPELSMDIKANLDSIYRDFGNDNIQVYYTTNNGTNWYLLGSTADPDWYNANYNSLGNNNNTASISSWTRVQHNLCSLIGQSCVKFLITTNNLYYGGADSYFAFDNFKIQNAIDVGVTNIVEPVASGCLYSDTQHVEITVFNTSCTAVSNIPATFVISGATSQTLTGTVPGPIAGNSSASYTFPGTINMSGLGTYYFRAFTALPADSNNLNDTTPLMTVITNQPKISAFPYIQPFDTSKGYWLTPATTGDTGRHFTWGVVPYLGGPEGDGNSMYLSAPNNGWFGDVWAESPVFDFSNNTDPQLSMDIQYGLGNDYGNNQMYVAYSTDGGNTWTNLDNTFTPNAEWYNDGYSNTSSWNSGTDGNWTYMQHDLCELSGQSCVKFRISSYDLYYGGSSAYFAFDNFSISAGGKDDIQPIEIVNPGSGICGNYTTNQTVTVDIQNNTCRPMYNVPVTLVMSGTGSATLNEIVPGPIPGLGRYLYTFNGTVNMNNAGTYNLAVTTNLATDTFSANNTWQDVFINNVPVTTYPYIENFDGDNGGWISHTTDSSRLWRRGSLPYLNGPQGNGNSWYLDAQDDGWADIWIESPVFNLAGLTNPVMSMQIKANLDSIYRDFGNDAIRVYYTLNGDQNWYQLGSNTDPNWYNNYTSLGNNNGTPSISSWTQVEHSLGSLLGQTCVKIALSTNSLYYGGADAYFAFDNFEIQDGFDVGVTNILEPVNNGCLFSASQEVEITVFNYGTAPINNVPVTFVINGATNQTLTGTVPGPIAGNGSVSYVFPGTVDMSGLGTYNFRAFTALPGDVNNLNDSTAVMTITTVQPKIATFPYIQPFDTSKGYWLTPATTGDTGRHFTWGVVPYLGGPEGDGNSMYLTVPNNGWYGDVWAESPVFDLSNNTDPQLNMDVQYGLGYDYGNNQMYVAYSIDGGNTWTNLDNSFTPNAEWYNDGYSNTSSWNSATVGNWTHMQHDLCEVSGQPCVKFRVSSYDLYYSGSSAYFAFDNFSISAGGKDDIQPIEIVNPGSGICGNYTTNQTVTVDIQNNTCRLMYNVPVTLQMTGAGTATLNEVMPGPIPGLGRYLYTFNGTVNMNNAGTYNLAVTTNLATDSFPANNTWQDVFINNVPISTYPYLANFDTSNDGWISHTTDSSRLWRRDSLPYLNGPQGNGNSWYLDAQDNGWDDIWIESPVFNLAGLTNPVMSMDIKANLDHLYNDYGNDAIRVYYTTNADQNWYQLGNSSDPDWYNNYTSLGNNNGTPEDTSWTIVQHSLCPVQGQTCVKIGISTSSLYYGGADAYFAFDNFKIQDGIVDVGAGSITEPLASGCLYSNSQQAQMTVYNFGCTAATNIPVSFVITGAVNQVLTGTVPGPIAANTYATYTFPTTFDMSGIGTYNFRAITSLPGDTNQTNDSTAVYSVTVSQPKISTYPYLQNFDTSNGYWLTPVSDYNGTIDTNRRFVWGAVPYLSGAAGQGNSMYLSAPSNEWGDVWAESPVFDLSTLTNPMLSMYVQYSLGYDYGNDQLYVAYSTDGGNSWTNLDNSFIPNAEWYNDGYSNTSSWNSGTDGNWTYMQHNLCGLTGQHCVKFRVSTYSLYYGGSSAYFAFDNFRIVNAPIDAQLTSVTGCYGSAYQMEATVLNNNILCTTPANITSIDISYTINGATPVTNTYTGLNIAPGSAQTISIPDILIPSNTSTLQVWCSNPNGQQDQLVNNDSLYANLAVWPNCNEHCSNAIFLRDQVTLASQNTFATPTASEDSSIFDNCTPGVTIEDPAWYYFITDCSGQASVSFTNINCSPSPTGIQVAIEQLKPGLSPCVLSNYTNVFCDNPLTDSSIVWHGTALAPNSTFYITIDGQGGNQCTFDIVVNHLVDTILPATGVNIVNDSTCASTSKILSPIGGSIGLTGVWAWFANSACTVLLDTGSSYTVTPLVTTNYWVRAENLCDTTPVAKAVAFVLQPPVITTNPLANTLCDGQDASFTVAASSIAALSYQWQVSTDGGSTFNDITTGGNNPTYSGFTSSTIGLTGAVYADSGYQYRCRVINSCGTQNSNAANLVVNPQPAISLGATPSICYAAYAQTVNLNYTGTTGNPDNYSIVWNTSAANAGFVNVSDVTLVPASIVISIPAAAQAASYSGTISLNNSSTGCSATIGTPFNVTVLSTPAAFVVSGGACVPAIMGLSGSDIGINYQLMDSSNYVVTDVGSPVAGTGTAINFGDQNIAGIYSVVATDVSDGCTADMTGVSTVDLCTSTWTGSTSSDWFTSTNWDPAAVPDNCAANVVIPFGMPFDPVISGTSSVQIGDMNIAAGVTLSLEGQNLNVCGNWTGGDRLNANVIGNGITIINGTSAQNIDGYTKFGILQINNNTGNGVWLVSGGNVSIITGLHLQAGVIDVASDATLQLLSGNADNNSYIDDFSPNFVGAVTGNVTAERYVPVPGSNQHYISSPVGTPGFNQLSATGPDGAYIIPTSTCDENSSAYISPYGTVFQYNDGHMPSGECMLGNWEIRSAGNTVNGLGYSAYLTGNSTLSLTSTANTGDISVSTYNSAYPAVPTLQQTTDGGNGAIESGWALVGNPYPSALDLTVDRTSYGYDDQVQVWKTSGPFAGTWQPTTITGENGVVVIPPFQAFMVHVTTGKEQGTYAYPFFQSERTRTTNIPFYRSQNQNTLQLTLDYNGMQDMTTVSFNPSATNGFDAVYDAVKQDGGAGNPTLYTFFPDATTWYAINTIPSLTQTAAVPMGLRPNNTGTMTITPQGIESFDPTTYIYLEDKQTGMWTNLRNGAYTFTTTPTENQQRFVLHFTPPAIILTSDASCEQPGMINIEQPGMANWNYTVTDNNNVIVSSGVLNSGSPVSVSVIPGVYTITLKDNTGYTVVKTVQVQGSQPVVAAFGASETTAQVLDNIQFASTTANAATYSWDFGDGATASGKSATHSYSSQGVYTVTLTVTSSSGCISTATQTITVTSRSITGVIDLPDDRLSIWSYDNTVFVDFTKVSSVDAEITLYDELGQVLSDERFGKSSIYTRQLVNTGEAAYIIVRVISDDRITTKKVFIANIDR